mmetsp:Transcript_124357/g.247974  ORF Transcript_124357/g.247974 Transcript_124357/m.247974 type:complete len:252 (-) Transcript_124357:79-834(-)
MKPRSMCKENVRPSSRLTTSPSTEYRVPPPLSIQSPCIARTLSRQSSRSAGRSRSGHRSSRQARLHWRGGVRDFESAAPGPEGGKGAKTSPRPRGGPRICLGGGPDLGLESAQRLRIGRSGGGPRPQSGFFAPSGLTSVRLGLLLGSGRPLPCQLSSCGPPPGGARQCHLDASLESSRARRGARPAALESSRGNRSPRPFPPTASLESSRIRRGARGAAASPESSRQRRGCLRILGSLESADQPRVPPFSP